MPETPVVADQAHGTLPPGVSRSIRGPGIGTRFGTRGLSIGPHRGRSTITAEFPAPTRRSRLLPCSQEVPPHMARMTVVLTAFSHVRRPFWWTRHTHEPHRIGGSRLSVRERKNRCESRFLRGCQVPVPVLQVGSGSCVTHRDRFQAALTRDGRPPALANAPCSRLRSWRIGCTRSTSPPAVISTLLSTIATCTWRPRCALPAR